ncbi:hypothetical protein HAP94_05030 [Acidithiobacillus ferrivorans]|nr:hypothetical protein [Acidithiobacillus ferrivorans]
MNIDEINVTHTDNELYIIASTNNGSSEICHIKSGYHKDVNYTIYPRAILSPGEYNLTVIGINWGAEFNFQLTTKDIDGDIQSFELSSDDVDSAEEKVKVGVVWTKSLQVNVEAIV